MFLGNLYIVEVLNMNANIEQAKNEVESVFSDLSPIVLEIVNKYSRESDRLISKLSSANSFTNAELREYILALSIESYMFGISKDASILKQECATTLLKEKQADIYNQTTGTQAVRQNQSIIDSIDQQVVSMLYSAVANSLKTKQDEIHRVVAALQGILISRNAEAKLVSGNSMLNDRLSDQLEEQEIFTK